MKKPTEEELVAAALALGQATTECSPEEREHVKKLYQKVQSFADSQKAKGITLDRSAFFAAGLILHPQVEHESVIQAAIKYVDLDVLFVQAMQDAIV